MTTRHAEKIWRSVVFAGAMLGAPLVSADAPQKPTPSKPGPAKPTKPEPQADTEASLNQQLANIDKLIKAATDAVAAAQNQADRDTAKAKLERHKAERAALVQRIAALKSAAKPTTPLQQLEQERAELQQKLDAATAAVAAAQNEADRKTAKAKLDALAKDKAELDKKITAEKQKLARPRTGENDRPVGRGFVLA